MTKPDTPRYADTMYDCIVLAAGASSRMGAWKLLLPWQGLTVIETVVEESLAAARRVIVVAGYRSGDLAELFAGADRVKVVVHEGWRKGQLTSLQRGLAEVATDAFFVTLGDMPGLTREVFAELAARRDASPQAPAAPRAFRPGSPEHPGHPVLFDGTARSLIEGLDPSLSMRHVFPNLTGEYLFQSGLAASQDLDTPSDYRVGHLDPARTRCPPRLAAEAVQSAERLRSAAQS